MLIILFICTSSLHVGAQDHCIFGGRFIRTDLYPQSAQTFDLHSHIDFYKDSLVINLTGYPVKSVTTTPFDNRDDLLRAFSCIYDFYSYSENLVGEVLRYDFQTEVAGIGKKLIFVYFNDSGSKRYFVMVDDGLYYFSNYQSYVACESDIFRFIPESEIQYQYVSEIDTAGIVSMISAPVFETVTEQILVKDASNRIVIIPLEFDTSWAYFHQEYSQCPEAIFDTIYEQILKKEVADSLIIHPAEFSTVTEQVLARGSFTGAHVYDRQLIPTDTVILISERISPRIIDVDPNCKRIEYIHCLDYAWDIVPAIDTILENIYEHCPDGYAAAGTKCYTTESVVPAVYETRSYERLIRPASVTVVEGENVYVTVMIIRIVNKEDIDSSCIQIVLDSLEYLKVSVPSQAINIEVPAEYSTRTYERYLEGGEIEIIKEGQEEIVNTLNLSRNGTYTVESTAVLCASQYSDCQRRSIARRLFEKDYLHGPDIILAKSFYNAIFEYQIDNDLLIGIIDKDFVEHLEVIFGF